MNELNWNPHRFLYIYGITAEQWAARYGIIPFTDKCECGRDLTTSIPWAQGSLRGLRAPPCECGNENRPYCVVRDSRYGDLFTGVEAQISKRRASRRGPYRFSEKRNNRGEES